MLPRMTNNEKQIFARLTLHEAVLTSALAQAWASVPEDQAQTLASEFIRHFRKMHLNPAADPASAEADAWQLALDT